MTARHLAKHDLTSQKREAAPLFSGGWFIDDRAPLKLGAALGITVLTAGSGVGYLTWRAIQVTLGI